MRREEPGTIDPALLYSIPAFKRATGLGRWALIQAERGGLRILKRHKARFILGRDFIEYLDMQARVVEGGEE